MRSLLLVLALCSGCAYSRVGAHAGMVVTAAGTLGSAAALQRALVKQDTNWLAVSAGLSAIASLAVVYLAVMHDPEPEVTCTRLPSGDASPGCAVLLLQLAKSGQSSAR